MSPVDREARFNRWLTIALCVLTAATIVFATIVFTDAGDR